MRKTTSEQVAVLRCCSAEVFKWSELSNGRENISSS